MADFSIPRKRFGRTEIQMPVFSCGGMRYMQSWKDEPFTAIAKEGQANLIATIDRALSLGINHIETASGYGTSEVQLGQMLSRYDRDQLIVQTKGGPRENPAEFRASLEKSFEKLGLDRVDLFGLHGINNQEKFDWTFRKGGCLDVVREFQRDGRIGHVGFSTHARTDLILDIINTGELDYVNLHWYFVNDLNWRAVQAANAQDMGVFIISPNDKGGKLYDPPVKLLEACAPLTPMAFNNLFCLSRDEVHTLSIGASCPSDFDAHIESLKHYEQRRTMSDEIAQRIYTEMDRVIGDGWCKQWFQGVPEHYDVPNEINLLETLRLWGWAKGMDMVEFAKMRYNLLGSGGDWFPGNKVFAEENQVLPGLKDLVSENPFADRLDNILHEAHQLLHAEPEKRLSES